MKKSSLSKNQKIILGVLLSILGLAFLITAYALNFTKSPFAKSPAYIYILYIGGALVTFIGACYIYGALTEFKKINVKEMTMIGLQSAITVVLYYFVKFNLPFFPGWLDIQVSEIPALITTFAYGPYAGTMVIIIRFLIKLPATMTLGVGELADLILGVALVVISGNMYKKMHTLKGAVISLVTAMAICTALACLTNYTILIPAYMNLAGFKMETLLGMMPHFANLNEHNFMIYYIFAGVIPFNLFRYTIVFVLTFILYKRVKFFLDKLKK